MSGTAEEVDKRIGFEYYENPRLKPKSMYDLCVLFKLVRMYGVDVEDESRSWFAMARRYVIRSLFLAAFAFSMTAYITFFRHYYHAVWSRPSIGFGMCGMVTVALAIYTHYHMWRQAGGYRDYFKSLLEHVQTYLTEYEEEYFYAKSREYGAKLTKTILAIATFELVRAFVFAVYFEMYNEATFKYMRNKTIMAEVRNRRNSLFFDYLDDYKTFTIINCAHIVIYNFFVELTLMVGCALFLYVCRTLMLAFPNADSPLEFKGKLAQKCTGKPILCSATHNMLKFQKQHTNIAALITQADGVIMDIILLWNYAIVGIYLYALRSLRQEVFDIQGKLLLTFTSVHVFGVFYLYTIGSEVNWKVNVKSRNSRLEEH